jgi:hypothetical protein
MIDSNQNNIEIQDLVPNHKLPNILSLKSRKVKYKSPNLKYFKSFLESNEEAIEVIITTDSAIPIRADTPMLYIGEFKTAEMEQIDDKSYRFLLLNIGEIKEGLDISWNWMSEQLSKPIPVKFKFTLE